MTGVFAGPAGLHCAVQVDATVACWGSSAAHGIAEGDPRRLHLTPARVGGLRDAVEVAPGREHLCARIRDGSVRCWGANDSGQLGSAAPRSSARPVLVPGIARSVAIASDHTSSCAVRADGEVRCWGRMGSGEGPVVPVTAIDVGGPVTSVAMSDGNACAVRRDGRVSCWGAGPPTRVGGLDDVAAIALSGTSACALRRDGSVACWGFDGRHGPASGAPARVEGVDRAVEIGAGNRYACARREDGRVLCWGERGAPGDATDPSVVVEGATDLAVGPGDACAVVGGEARCWGHTLTSARREPPAPVQR